jgi:hypothetical protein
MMAGNALAHLLTTVPVPASYTRKLEWMQGLPPPASRKIRFSDPD